MKNNYIKAAFLMIAITACQSPKSSDINSERINESLSSDAAKSHWKEVQDESSIKALESLKSETTVLVSDRRPEVIKEPETAPTLKDPVMPQELVASVQVRSGGNLENYRGNFRIRSVDENVIRGVVENDAEFNIFYKIPNARLDASIKAEQNMELYYDSGVRSGSFNQTLFLKDGRRPVLLSIEEGSMTPFEKSYKDVELAVRQIIEDGKNTGAVEIRFGRDRFRLEQGERRLAKGQDGTVEFYLYSSYAKPENTMEEGMNYFIRLFATAK